MDVTVVVSWENGQATRHQIRGLPDQSAEELAERLERDLASYLDPAELPLSAEGWALGWASVDVERVQP
jgi:hypothetical protein